MSKRDDALVALNPLIPKIRKLYQEIEHHYHDNVNRAIQLGSLLSDAKESLGHGQFEGWIGVHFPEISERTARVFMQVFKISQTPEFSKRQSSAALPSSVSGIISEFKPKKPRSRPRKRTSRPKDPDPDLGSIEENQTTDEDADGHPIILDRLKEPLPIHTHESWSAATEKLQEWLSAVSEIARDIDGTTATTHPAGAFLSAQSVASRLKEAAAAIREALPWTTCPYCRAHPRAMKNCDVCRIEDVHLGWVNRRTHERGSEALKTA